MTHSYSPHTRQMVSRYVQYGAAWRNDGTPDGTLHDVTHVWIGNERTAAGGMARCSYIVGVDTPEEIAWLEAHMAGLCAKINEHFDTLAPRPGAAGGEG